MEGRSGSMGLGKEMDLFWARCMETPQRWALAPSLALPARLSPDHVGLGASVWLCFSKTDSLGMSLRRVGEWSYLPCTTPALRLSGGLFFEKLVTDHHEALRQAPGRLGKAPTWGSAPASSSPPSDKVGPAGLLP